MSAVYGLATSKQPHSLSQNIMKKVLPDSSVWVSLFARDGNYQTARKIINEIIDCEYMIILPTLVYIEVINSLYRLKVGVKEIEGVKKYFVKNKRVHFCHTTSMFWINEIPRLVDSINLRTLDLIILAHALKYDALLISFDKKMDMAYKKIAIN